MSRADDRLTGTILDYQGNAGPGDWGRDHQFRPGVAAKHAVGVRFQGPWDKVGDGFHEHVRRQARALALAGCPVHLQGITPLMHYGAQEGSEEERVLRLMEPLTDAAIAKVEVQIQMVVPSEGQLQRLVAFSQSAMRVLEPDDIDRIMASRIIYTVWERSPAPQADVVALNRVAQCWTACEENRRMLIDSGVAEEKVRTVPLPYFDDDPLLAFAKRDKKPRKVPRFYHIGKWEPRKNQHRMIGCFLRAFRPGEAELYLKTSRFAPQLPDYPQSPIVSARYWMLKDPRVQANGWRFPGHVDAAELASSSSPYRASGRSGEALEEADVQKELGFKGLKIYDTRLSEEQMRGLHAACDVYLSLSHGEGWDMPAFDAKLAGNGLIYTESGGPQDFAAENDARIPAARRVPCHVLYGWTDGSTYVDHDDAEVEVAMRAFAEVVRGGAYVSHGSLERFRAENVGKIMLKYARELASNLPGEA